MSDKESIVKAYCDNIDKHLLKFRQSHNLKDAANPEVCSIFKVIVNLEDVDIRADITRYLSSREELFDICKLCWDNNVNLDTSSVSKTDLNTLRARLVNLTDCSADMCYEFGKRGLLQMLFKHLHTCSHSKWSTKSALTIVYNCCWNVPENRVICREYIGILQECSQSESPNFQADAFLALSYIIDKSEAHKISMNEPCLKFLLAALASALDSPDRRSSVYGYATLEILQGLHQIDINDSNKLLVVELGGLELLERILVEDGSDNDEKLWAARGIWQLAFKEDNKVKIRERTALLDELRRIKDTSKNIDVHFACAGALFVINDVVDIDGIKTHTPFREHGEGQGIGGHSAVTAKSDVIAPKQTEGHVMISYQHASQERMLRVKGFLEKCGYNVWMDIDKMRGDILDSMAKAVQGASVVLVCMTLKFKESQHCRTEATYAYTLQKPIIPLMLEDHFTPGDWLGALVGMKKYYPFFSDDLMEQGLSSLIKELGDRGRRETEEVVLPVLENVTGAIPYTGQIRRQNDDAGNDEVDCGEEWKSIEPSKPATHKDKTVSSSKPFTNIMNIETWDADRVADWLKSYGIDTTKNGFRELDGPRLKQIKNLLRLAPEFCLGSLKDELGLSFWEVLSFVDALKTIWS